MSVLVLRYLIYCETQDSSCSDIKNIGRRDILIIPKVIIWYIELSWFNDIAINLHLRNNSIK